MTKTITREHVAELFTTVTHATEGDRIVYNVRYMFAGADTVERDVYELVSDIAHASGLSHSFSFEVISRACNILTKLNVWDGDDIDDDALREAVESATPVYNHELLKIVNTADYGLVNDALAESGNNDIITACSYAWDTAIYNAVHELYREVVDYNNDNAQ